jgi:hypothetical protein
MQRLLIAVTIHDDDDHHNLITHSTYKMLSLLVSKTLRDNGAQKLPAYMYLANLHKKSAQKCHTYISH